MQFYSIGSVCILMMTFFIILTIYVIRIVGCSSNYTLLFLILTAAHYSLRVSLCVSGVWKINQELDDGHVEEKSVILFDEMWVLGIMISLLASTINLRNWIFYNIRIKEMAI